MLKRTAQIPLKFIGFAIILVSLSACAESDFMSQMLTPTRQVQSSVLTSITTDPVVGRNYKIDTAHSDVDGILDVKIYEGDILLDVQSPRTKQTYFKSEYEWIPKDTLTHTFTIKTRGENHLVSASVLTVAVKAIGNDELAENFASASSTGTTQPAKIACLNDAVLVEDVTIPAGTDIEADTAFDKTWRIKNTGTCVWGDSYRFKLVDGPDFGAAEQIMPIVVAGAPVEVTLGMRAPEASGSYRGAWRLFSPDGTPFGEQFYADIVVPSTCQPPKITQFEATPASIESGQSTTLSWHVDGATSVSIDPPVENDIVGSSVKVSPTENTTYTLTAHDGECASSEKVTVSVIQSCDGLSIDEFSANPTTIHVGDTSKLTWQVTGATSVRISPSPEVSAAENALTVAPTQNTTYVLSAKNDACTKTAQATIAVSNAQTLINFVDSAPTATWKTPVRQLDWNGTPADVGGYAAWQNSVILQKGVGVQRVLDIHPKDDAFVQGRYPINLSGGVRPTDELRLQLAYLQGATQSSGATYSAKFVPTGGSSILLGSLTLDADGTVFVATFPLQNVPNGVNGEFFLQVDKGINPTADVAVWIQAELVRP